MTFGPVQNKLMAGTEETSRSTNKTVSVTVKKHQTLKDLAAKGVLSLDVFPDDMTTPLVNRYLEIKARHLL